MLETELKEFLASTDRNRNRWFDYPWVKVYIRKGAHVLNGTLVKTLDIANVVIEEHYRSQGYFKVLLDICFTANPYEYVYIENVCNFQLRDWLREKGFIEVKESDGDYAISSFYCKKMLL